MILSQDVMMGLVLGSLGIAMLAPGLLLVLLWRDWRRGRLW